MRIGIAGAGLLGRLLAWQLARAGHAVSVFDAAAGPQPVFRSEAGDAPCAARASHAASAPHGAPPAARPDAAKVMPKQLKDCLQVSSMMQKVEN